MHLCIPDWAIQSLSIHTRLDSATFPEIIEDYRIMRRVARETMFEYLRELSDVEYVVSVQYNALVLNEIVDHYTYSDEHGHYIDIDESEEDEYRDLLAKQQPFWGLEIGVEARTLRFFHNGQWYARPKEHLTMTFVAIPDISFETIQRKIEVVPDGPIKTIYRQLVKKHHPDLKPEGEKADATHLIQIINDALDRNDLTLLRALATKITTETTVEMRDMFENITQTLYEVVPMEAFFVISPENFTDRHLWSAQYKKMMASIKRTFADENYVYFQRQHPL